MTAPDAGPVEAWVDTAARIPLELHEATAAERELLGLCLRSRPLVDHAAEEASAEDFADPFNARLFAVLIEAFEQDPDADPRTWPPSIAESWNEQLAPKIDEDMTLGRCIGSLMTNVEPGEDDAHRVRELARQIRTAAEFERPEPEAEPSAQEEPGRWWEDDPQTPKRLELPPLVFLDPTGWQDRPIPERQWLVRHRIPMANVTLLYGDGAAGKTTIALQLAAALQHANDWLGAVIDEPGRAMFLSAEEDNDEIHRRLGAIVEQQGIGFRDLSGLKLLCMPGEDMVLGMAGKSGAVQPTPLFHRLEKAVCDYRPALLVIESVADVFAGNENDRAQVRQFVALLRRLAIKSGAAVLVLAHPSVAGMNSGTGTSGSTGWNNSVRSRLYFTIPSKKPQDSEETDPAVRELRVLKSNYGPAGEVVKLRYENVAKAGVFIPDGGPSSLQKIATESAIDDTYMQLKDTLAAQGRTVSPNPSAAYAPKVFETMPGANGYNRRAFMAAQERLLAAGRIAVKMIGPPSKQRAIIVRPGHHG